MFTHKGNHSLLIVPAITISEKIIQVPSQRSTEPENRFQTFHIGIISLFFFSIFLSFCILDFGAILLNLLIQTVHLLSEIFGDLSLMKNDFGLDYV